MNIEYYFKNTSLSQESEVSNSMDQHIELEYLRRIENDDQKSFDALFMHYQPKLVHFINGFIKDKEAARDLSQDLFLKIWLNRSTLSRISSFKSYLFQMARHAVYDYYDHSLVKEKYEVNQVEFSLTEYSIEADLYAKELELSLDLAVEKMQTQRKLIYNMSRKEGLSNDEIALRLNLNKRTIENQISLALSTLRLITKSVNSLFF